MSITRHDMKKLKSQVNNIQGKPWIVSTPHEKSYIFVIETIKGKDVVVRVYQNRNKLGQVQPIGLGGLIGALAPLGGIRLLIPLLKFLPFFRGGLSKGLTQLFKR